MSFGMFSALDTSAASRVRGGVICVCGLFARSLIIASVVFAGELLPQQVFLTGHFVVACLPSFAPPQKVAARSLCVLPRVQVQKPQNSGAALIPETKIASLELLNFCDTRSGSLSHFPVVSLPPPSVADTLSMSNMQSTVRTGLFGRAAESVDSGGSGEQIRTGAFGNSDAEQRRAEGKSKIDLPILGSFGLPYEHSAGNQIGGFRSTQGALAGAVFGSYSARLGTDNGPGGDKVTTGAIAVGTGNGHVSRDADASKVAMGMFENVGIIPTQVLTTSQTPSFQPIEIISKPSPLYTEEARRLGIQGEVALSVVFQATGTIRIIGIMKFLGHGLDQAAEQAAAQIQFNPAQRDGKPTDFPAILRIQFRLADESI